MSPWWLDRLCVELGPERVQLIRLPRAWPRSAEQHWQAQVSADDARPQWAPALEALGVGLGVVSYSQRASLRLRLSNRFVRYDIVPWSDDLHSEAEVLAFARHRMRETYGDIAEGWEIRLGAGWPGVPRVAAAVDRELLHSLAELAGGRGLRLQAVEPQFAAVADGHRRELRGEGFWLAVHESARIVLARTVKGEWLSFAAARVAEAVAPTVLAMLAREAMALAEPELPRRLYLHGIAARECENLVEAGWEVVRLQEPGADDEAMAA